MKDKDKLEKIWQKLSANLQNSHCYYADIHVHTTLKPYNYYYGGNHSPKSNIWYQDKPRKNEYDDRVVHFSQADLTSLAQGGAKLVFVAISPLEKNWAGGSNSFFNHLGVNFFLGIPIKRVHDITKESYVYFEQMNLEFEFLKSQIKEQHSILINNELRTVLAKIPVNFNEFKSHLKDSNTILIIPTIEGGHSLLYQGFENDKRLNLSKIFSNIEIIKNQAAKPFFITLTHHFYNKICGHCRSIYSNSEVEKLVQNLLLDQTKGMDTGITPEGIEIVNFLLGINKYSNIGQRILIDIKHMSILSRRIFYSIIEKHNLENQNDKIPIIASHVAYSGIKTFDELAQINENFDDVEVIHPFYNCASINLCDEDIKAIYLSGGLIGLNLDERVASSKRFRNRVEKLKLDQTILEFVWAKQVFRQFADIAKVIIEDNNIKDKSHIWHMFSIGSDYDGFINPIDTCATSFYYKSLEGILIYLFEHSKFFENNNLGLTAHQAVRKIMYENAVSFVEKYYFKVQSNDNEVQISRSSST